MNFYYLKKSNFFFKLECFENITKDIFFKAQYSELKKL